MTGPAAGIKLPVELESLLAKYEVVEWLGEGGMGVVFLVRHRLLGERRVIKMIHPERAQEPEFRDRFLHEARTAIRYRHPNIAQVFDFSADEGRAYLVMEYIDGITLQDLLRVVGPIKAGFAVAIGSQVLRALGLLHRNGVIHRDVSTDNIMLCRSEEGQPLIKLIDLGLAKWMDSDVALTGAQVFLGKIRYAPPEQFSIGTSELDPRGDLYSLGIVLYELVTGCYPILGNDASSIIAGHLFHPPRPFAETDPEGRVPEALRAVLIQALEKNRDDRIPDARRFEECLRAAVPSWSDHGVGEGELDRLIDRVRIATTIRPGKDAVDARSSEADGASPLPARLGATANIAGGTWLGRTAAPRALGRTVVPEESRPTDDFAGAERALDSRPDSSEDPLQSISAAPAIAPAAGTPLLAARERSRLPWFVVSLGVAAAPVILGLWMTKLPHRPSLPEQPEPRESGVSSALGREPESARSGSEKGGDVHPPGRLEAQVDGATAPATMEQRTRPVSTSPARRVGGGRPSYPEIARARSASGVVRLDLEVLPSGQVGGVHVVGEADPDLAAAARDAVVDWQFEPATEDGRPVTSSYRVELKFEPPHEGGNTGAGSSWEPPVRLYAVEPEYPDVARERGIEGELAAELTIDPQGRVVAVAIQRGLSPELDRAAEAALRRWRFAPGRRDGRLVESKYAVTIRFDLGR